MVSDVRRLIAESVRAMLEIARNTLEEYGSHLPTAVLHTMEGLFPVVLPFKNDAQKKALVGQVKKQALDKGAYAVTMITCGRVRDSRTGLEEETIVLATTIQRSGPYVVTQSFFRDADRRVIGFGEVLEGEAAVKPGQMMIFPDWHDEVCH
jgi:hypothetical protein